MQNLKDRINEIESTNREGLERAERLSIQEQREIYAQREYEALKFEQFKRIIDGQRYFRIQHFRDLGIDYQIAIHLSAKNVGKTTELYRLIRACLERGKKFIYGRVTVSELETEIEKFREDDISPVYMVKQNSRYYFYRKEDVNDFLADNPDMLPTYTMLNKYGCEIVGKGMAFMNSNVLGSGNYKDYDTVFFDEIVSYTPKEYVNNKILYNWGCAISTILRNKSQLTVIMMGNLQNNVTEVPILRYYGIDVQDNLRVIKRTMEGSKEPCTILYVNSGSLYNNALKNQASVAHHASLEDRLFMEHNKIINTSVKVLNHSVVSDMDSLIACALEFEDEFYALELRGYEDKDDEEDQYFALVVHPMTITTALKTDIFTHDPVVGCKFTKVIYRKNMRSIFKFMYKLFVSKLMYFANAHSLDIGIRCLEEIIRPYLDATAPN